MPIAKSHQKAKTIFLAVVISTIAGFCLFCADALAQDKHYVPFWAKNQNQNSNKNSSSTSAKPTTTTKSPQPTTGQARLPAKTVRYTPPTPKKQITLIEEPSNSLWLDVTAAESLKYPIPLFRGRQTKILRNTEGSLASDSMYGKQVILQTRDSAHDVFMWYRSALPSAGYVLNERYPAQSLFDQSYMVRGDSQTDQAMVSINAQNDERGPCTHIQVSIAPKHNSPF